MADATKRLWTTAYEAFTAAGDEGLNAAQLAEILGGRPVDKANAGRAIRALVDEKGIELCGKGRWRAIPGWTQIINRGQHKGPLVDKLPEPEIGVDVTAEEYQRQRASRGRKAAAPDPAVDIDPQLAALMTPDERRRYRLYQARTHEDDWRVWVTSMFPAFATKPFGPHHEQFWEHVWTIQDGVGAAPHIDVWSRDHGKSSSLEMAVVALAARRRRHYTLYTCETQDQADEHVSSIATLLQSEMVRLAYPDVANPELGKHGSPREWRRNRLRTASGFTVDALGLDVAARGKRIDEHRPDLLIFDDIDNEKDTPATVKKKIRAVTRKILPTRSQDACTLGAQNRVHGNSIFARLVSGGGMDEPEPADFLANRVVVGPVPAVWNLQYEQRALDGGRFRHVITDGDPSWVGMPLDACQDAMDEVGLDAFLSEYQHEDSDLVGSMFGHLDFSAHGPIRVSEVSLPRLLHTCVWVDPSGSKTEKSDSCGVVVDSLGADRLYYRRWAWERIAAADEAIEVAVKAALDFGAEVVGVETDYGGHAWEPIFRQVLTKVVEKRIEANGGEFPEGMRIPRYEHAKAGQSRLSKEERIERMASEYNLGRFRHVEGHVTALERGLKRFPEFKPYDVVDAGYWSWKWLADKGGDPNRTHRMRVRAPSGGVGEVTAAGLG